MTRLLLIDDRESELYTLLLKAEGIDVTGLSSAKEALKWLGQNDVDAVITDLAMPTMDGLTFIECLDTTQYRIAVLTGHPVESIAAAILRDAGVEKIFLKGNNSRDLVKKIREWLEI